jgi:hypothetical protein
MAADTRGPQVWKYVARGSNSGRSIDKQRVEVLGPLSTRLRYGDRDDHVDDSTTRTVIRTYRWDAKGQRQLSRVTEEDARRAASGDKQVTRTTSNSDGNGHLQVVEREIANTTKSSPDTEEMKTTLYHADSNGGFSTLRQTQEVAKHNADNSNEVKKTMLVPDGNGNWKVGEVKEQTVKVDGKNRTTEKRIARPGVDDKLSELFRTVWQETETASGEKSTNVDTYSPQVPGSSSDGSLQLTRRVTTSQKKDSSGEKTEQPVKELTWATRTMACTSKANTWCSMLQAHKRPKRLKFLMAPTILKSFRLRPRNQTSRRRHRKNPPIILQKNLIGVFGRVPNVLKLISPVSSDPGWISVATTIFSSGWRTKAFPAAAPG